MKMTLATTTILILAAAVSAQAQDGPCELQSDC